MLTSPTSSFIPGFLIVWLYSHLFSQCRFFLDARLNCQLFSKKKLTAVQSHWNMHSSKTACWQTASTITLSRPHPIKTVQPSCFGAPLCFSFCFLSSLFFLNLKIESLTGIWYTLHRCTACHSVCCVLKLQQQSCFHVPRSGANHSHAVNAHTSSHVLVYIPSFSLAWHNTATTNISSTEVLFADFLILPSSRRCVNPPPLSF